MASPPDSWDAEKMFNTYLHDYMVKRNMHTTAEIFRKEANFDPVPLEPDPPGGFLKEWWSLSYDVYSARQLHHRRYIRGEASDKNMKRESGPVMSDQSAVHQQRPGKDPADDLKRTDYSQRPADRWSLFYDVYSARIDHHRRYIRGEPSDKNMEQDSGPIMRESAVHQQRPGQDPVGDVNRNEDSQRPDESNKPKLPDLNL